VSDSRRSPGSLSSRPKQPGLVSCKSLPKRRKVLTLASLVSGGELGEWYYPSLYCVTAILLASTKASNRLDSHLPI